MSVLAAAIGFALLTGVCVGISEIVKARRAKRFPKQLEEMRKQFEEMDKNSEKK